MHNCTNRFSLISQNKTSKSFEEKYERKVESNDELAAADEELKDTFALLLRRFYRLFESIYNYVRDLKYFLEDVEAGTFIQMNSLEAIFQDEDGKQLLVSDSRRNINHANMCSPSTTTI